MGPFDLAMTKLEDVYFLSCFLTVRFSGQIFFMKQSGWEYKSILENQFLGDRTPALF